MFRYCHSLCPSIDLSCVPNELYIDLVSLDLDHAPYAVYGLDI